MGRNVLRHRLYVDSNCAPAGEKGSARGDVRGVFGAFVHPDDGAEAGGDAR